MPEALIAVRANWVYWPRNSSDAIKGDKVGVAISLGAAALGVVSDAGAAKLGGLALKEGLTAGRELSAGERLALNAANGAAGEARTAAALGDTVAGTQVSFRTSGGLLARADFVVKGGGIVETKTGGAVLSKAQAALEADIAAGRAVTPVGRNAAAAGFEVGQKTKLPSFRIDHQ